LIIPDSIFKGSGDMRLTHHSIKILWPVLPS